MTREQANRALYVVAFFAAIALIINLIVSYYMYGLFIIMPKLGLMEVIGVGILIALIVAPFIQENQFLFLLAVNCIVNSSYSNSFKALYEYITGTATLMSIGWVPGIVITLSDITLDSVGLVILGLRIAGFINEHRAGLRTRF
jgi:hypothetical protein